MNGDWRYRVLWFLRKICKINEGRIMPWYLRIIAYCMFPSRIIWDFNPWFKYDLMDDILTISGYRISREFLLNLTHNIPENIWFRIKDRKNATITMERYYPEHYSSQEITNDLPSDYKNESKDRRTKGDQEG